MTGPLRRLSFPGWRDSLIVLTGLSLIVYEAVIYRGPERWGLIMLYAGMIGSTAFLRQDEKKAGEPDEPSREDAK